MRRLQREQRGAPRHFVGERSAEGGLVGRQIVAVRVLVVAVLAHEEEALAGEDRLVEVQLDGHVHGDFFEVRRERVHHAGRERLYDSSDHRAVPTVLRLEHAGHPVGSHVVARAEEAFGDGEHVGGVRAENADAVLDGDQQHGGGRVGVQDLQTLVVGGDGQRVQRD